MSAEPSKIIIDCEGSLLAHRFAEYVPLWATYAAIKCRDSLSPPASVLNFRKEYRHKKLTLETTRLFLKENQAELVAWIKTFSTLSHFVADMCALDLEKLIALKDASLRKLLIKHYAQSAIPIVMLTTSPYIQLIADCVACCLPGVPFKLIYAPLPKQHKMHLTQPGVFNASPATASPPPGYSLLINNTRPPEMGWECYFNLLQQRLLNTNRFYIKETAVETPENPQNSSYLSAAEEHSSSLLNCSETLFSTKKAESSSAKTPPPTLHHPIPRYLSCLKQDEAEKRTPSPAERLVRSEERYGHPCSPIRT